MKSILNFFYYLMASFGLAGFSSYLVGLVWAILKTDHFDQSILWSKWNGLAMDLLPLFFIVYFSLILLIKTLSVKVGFFQKLLTKTVGTL